MYKKGDILLLNFPFSDFKNFKLRPVLLWEDVGNDYIVMPITSSKVNFFGEHFLQKNTVNNLKSDSYLKPFNVNTVDKNIIAGRLGMVTRDDLLNISRLFCGKFCGK